MLSRFTDWFRSSIRRRSALLIVSVMSILLSAFIIVDLQVQRKNTEEALLAKGKVMASSGALAVEQLFENAIASGQLTEAEVFDTEYMPIPNTDPPKYHTAYDRFTDLYLVKLQDGYLEDSDISFAAAVDKNGYLPTHNSVFSRPLTGDYQTDLSANRTKRLFDDETGINAAKNLDPYLHQVYYRDTGEVIWDISVPIMVNGRHWGAFRIGMSLAKVNQQLSAITYRMTIAGFGMIIAILLASYLVTNPMKLISKLSQLAEKVSLGIATEKSDIERIDEVGVLVNSINHIIDYHQNLAFAANQIANGDFSVDIEPKSEQDLLSDSFKIMVISLQKSILALEKERALLQTLLDYSPDQIYFKDKESKFIRISKSLRSHFGFSDVPNIEGKSDFDYFSLEHAQESYDDEQSIITTGKPIINKEEMEIWPNGRKSWVSTTKLPYMNEQGEIIGTFGISRDITEQKQMQSDLIANSEKMQHEIEQRKLMQNLLNTEKEILNTTLMSISEGVITTNKDGLVSFINPAAEQITGHTSKDSLDYPLSMVLKILNPESKESIPDVLGLLYNYGKNKKDSGIISPLILISKDNDKILIDTNISTIFSSDKSVNGHVIVFQDVTQKQKMETQSALSQKMESIGQMASGIAHEINTPIQYVGDNLRYLNRSFTKLITAIDIYQQWLKKYVNTPFTQAELDAVTESTDPRKLKMYINETPVAINESLAGVERVRKIVWAMREFSHPLLKEKRFSDINHAIETTATISRNEWKYVADLELDLDPGLPLVNCQIDEINQALLNMIINSGQAIKEVVEQNPEIKGKIIIKTKKQDSKVQIFITDTGNGIPETIQDRVFDPFFTTKGVGKGTGQGLYLTHNIIVKKHSGNITLESQPGQGTTFIIELPIDAEGEGDDNA
jgi:PAS domain S-box-containing protein